MDESFDPAPSGVFVVGGLLARGVAVFELARRWERLRNRPDIDIKYFKASECEHGSGEFRKFISNPKQLTTAERDKLRTISHEFLRSIVNPPYDKNNVCLLGIGVIQSEFYDAIRDTRARAVLGETPYRLTYALAMMSCAWAMKELGTGDAVSFIVDEHEEHSPAAPEAYRTLLEKNPNAASYMGSFDMADDKQCDVLQAADAVAFEIRRALNLALGNWKGQLRERFNILTDSGAMFLITHTKKPQLDWIVANHQPGEPFKLDSVMEMHFEKNISLRI